MKITGIRSAGLRHGTPEGGWANEIRPEDCVHTLVAVFTDEGITGWGSVFTNDELVRAALHLLEPLYKGENPLEPDRMSEKLHAHTFWMGRGGSVTAESTSQCGTSLERPPDSRWGVYWAGATGSACGRMLPS
jgi:D-galactarolactone cycloisomerase